MFRGLLFLLVILFSVTTPVFAQGGIEITEIMFDVPADAAGDANGDGTRGSRSDEFIEFYNSSSEPIDMSGFQIIEREGIVVYSFPVGTELQPAQFAVVFGAVGTAGFGANLPADALYFAVNEGVDENVGFDNGNGKSNFSNSADRVMLVNPLFADTLAEIMWGGDTDRPVEALSDKGIKLIKPYTLVSDSIAGPIGESVTRDLDASNLWERHTILTGDENLFFSPGAKAVESNEPPPMPVIITEIMFDVPQDEAGDANGDGVRGSRSDEFVEIYNEGDIAVDLTGFQLLDREGIVIYSFPDGESINPGQFAVVFGAVGSAGFGENFPPDALLFALHESDDDVGFSNGDKSNLSNSGDAVLLVNSISADTLVEVYWGSAEPQTETAIYLGPPNTVVGDTISGSIRQSVTRKIDNTLWGLHTVVSSDTNSLFSPGSNASRSPQTIVGDLIITEVLFDPPGDDIAGDANGDGVRGSRSDEFVEFYNRGSSSIDISNYQILGDGGDTLFTFPDGSVLGPNQFGVVFGAVGSAGYGNHIPVNTLLFAVHESDDNVGFEGSGSSNLSSSGALISIYNPANSETMMEVYWGDAAPLSPDAIYLGFPNSITGNDLSGSVDQSITHTLNSDKWDLHTIVSGVEDFYFSPGSDPQPTGVKDDATQPQDFRLLQNYPNPFNPSTVISFSLPSEFKTTLKVYNILGQHVKTLVNNKLTAGLHQVEFDASSLSSGIYIYQLVSGKFVSSKKMVLLK